MPLPYIMAMDRGARVLPRRLAPQRRERLRELRKIRERLRERHAQRLRVAEARASMGGLVCHGALDWAMRELEELLGRVERALSDLEGAMATFETCVDPRVAGVGVEDGGVPVALEGMAFAGDARYNLEEFSFVVRALRSGRDDVRNSRRVAVPASAAAPAQVSVAALWRIKTVAEYVSRRVEYVVETFYDVLGVGGCETFAGVAARIAAEGATPRAGALCARAEFVEQRVDDLYISLSCLGEGLSD